MVYSLMSACNPSINLFLNTTLMAFTGNRYLPFCLVCFQWPQGVKPPAGTIMCTCGCSIRFWPQVCSTLMIPAMAPRCLLSAAKVSMVALLQANSRLYNAMGDPIQFWFNSCG